MTWQAAAGFALLFAAAWAISEDRRGVSWRLVVTGIALQLVLALLLLKAPFAKEVFLALNAVVLALQRATEAGTAFVFGYLGGGPLPFEESRNGASFVLAFRALPLILVLSALSALLFHWRILPKVVQGFAWLLSRSLGIGGALGVGAAANVFVGMVESPILVRPYVSRMSRGELFALMTCGMATVAGTVMVLYATILGSAIPDALGQILSASVINVPAALVIAGLMVPAGPAITAGGLAPDSGAESAMDAVAAGTAAGVRLILNVAAMLVVLVAMVALINEALRLFPDIAGAPLTLQRMLGTLLAPLAWLIGVPWTEAAAAGSLLGTKLALNELIAYLDLAALPPEALSPRTRLILVYAMCGFANLGSLGILIGGLGTMAPDRRGEIAVLGLKALLAGFLATCTTGAIVALLTPQAA
ncbi:MAG: nucleoside transporter C-terminal domain-containing protein [Alphaproteobacteria bacterium]|nr:nucleoside transporter C-terminal domain-containing protein [Alphaproteobacteria bacterium]